MQRARARVGAVIVGACVACAAVACSLVTSLDGLSGGPGASSDAAAGDDTTNATSGDGSVIVPPGDDGAPAGDDGPASADDAANGVDAGDAGDAGSFCKGLLPAPVFCDDFDDDHALLVPTTWDQISSLNGAATLSQGEWKSRPNSMRIATTPGQSDYDVAAYRSFPAYAAIPIVVTFSFEVYVAAADTTSQSGAVLGALQLFGKNARYDLQLEATYDALKGTLAIDCSEDANLVDGGGPYKDHASSVALPLATWTRVTLVLQLKQPSVVSAQNTAQWTFGSTVVSSFVPAMSVVNGTPEILVGLPYVTPLDTSWSVYYDDVTFNAQAL